MNIDTELYKTFYIVAKQGSISHAAKTLYISQPAVSKSVQKLEALSGCTLFIREARGVRLTSEGELLFESVKKAFVHLENAQMNIQKLVNLDAGIVRIGISNTLCKYFFFPRLDSFHKAHPNINIQIINVPSPKTLILLDEGQIDFGIISIDENNDKYNYTCLLMLQDIFITSRIQETRQKIPLSKLLDYPVMMMEKGNQTRDYVDSFLRSEGIIIKPEIEIGSMDFLVEFAKIGIGVSCVIKQFVEQELKNGLVHELDIFPKPQSRQMGIVSAKNRLLSNASKAFIAMLKS